MGLFVPKTLENTYDGDFWVISQRLSVSMEDPLNLPEDLRFCFLCFTNRSGSNFLAQLLGTSRKLNEGRESYSHEEVVRVARNHALQSFRDYVSLVAQASAIGNRFVAKTAFSHLVLLANTGVLSDVLPRSDFIILERLDKLAQAISFSIAEQTRQWASFVQTTAADPPAYDFKRILALLQSITAQMRAFDDFFSMNGIIPMHMTYEDLAADPLAQASRVADHLGVADAGFDLREVSAQVQGRSLNEEWRQRFLRDISASALEIDESTVAC